MVLLTTTVRKRQLPDYRYYVEISTTGMKVTCRVMQDRGSIQQTREIFVCHKSEHKWLDKIEWFYQIACEHYPRQPDTVNVNKSGSL